MAPPFRIVDGFVDLGSGMVVRPGGVVTLSAAEVVLLSELLALGGQSMPLADLAAKLWPTQGRPDRLEPLLWGLRRKLAPVAGIFEHDQAGVSLHPNKGPLDVRHGYAAMIGTGPRHTLKPPAGVVAVSSNLWLADDVQALVGSLAAMPSDLPLRAAVDRWSHVPEGRAVALHATGSRLRRLMAHERRLILTEPVIRELHRPVRGIGRWSRFAAGEPETLWTLDEGASEGPIAPMPSAHGGLTVPGREDQTEATWGALLAGAGVVLIHGPEGSGRTRLLHALRESAVGRLGPQWHVRTLHLGGVLDSAGLTERLVRGLELAPRGRPEAAVTRALRSLSPLVLIVDDLDEVSPEVVSALLAWRQRSERCAVLATCRKPLRLPGALWVELPPLTIPERCRWVHLHTCELPGWTGLELDDAVLVALVDEVGGSPVSLQALVGRAQFMSPDLLLAAIRMERVGSSPTPGRAILEVAASRLEADMLAGLDRIVGLDRRVWLDDVVAAVGDIDVEPLGLLRRLVEAGLLSVVEDPVLLEPWFNVPLAVRELRGDALAAPDLAALTARTDRSLGRRAGAWADAMERGRDDLRTARRIDLLTSAMEAAIPRLTAEPDLAVDLCRALMIAWELGHVPPATLLAVLEQIEPTPDRAQVHALCAARLACDLGRMSRVEAGVEQALQASGPRGELAQLLRLDASLHHAGESRAEMSVLVQRLLVADAARIAYLPEMLDVLLVAGNAADVVEVADRHASLASELGSRWRTAQLALQGFRARAGLGRQRPQDLRSARQHLRVLQEIRDHRRFAAGLQWVARAVVASGDAAGALAMLDRSLPMIDAHGPWAVRHMARLDRARAHQLLGDAQAAEAAIEAFDALAATGPSLPPIIGAFDRVLYAVFLRDPEALQVAVDRVGAGSSIHHRYTHIFAGLIEAFGGTSGLHDPAGSGGGTGERLLQELVQAWRVHDFGGLAAAAQRIRRTPEWRSISLTGVVLRAAEAAAQASLAEHQAVAGGSLAGADVPG